MLVCFLSKVKKLKNAYDCTMNDNFELFQKLGEKDTWQ